MGALTSNRKLGDDYFTFNLQKPASYSPTSDFHISKKPKLSTSADQAPDEENPSKVSFQKYFQYPDLKSQFKRVPHAPVRRPIFGRLASSKNNGSKSNLRDNSSNEMENLFMKYNELKRIALEACSYTKKDEAVEVEDKREEVSEDSNTDDVEILENGRYHKWKYSGLGVDMDMDMDMDERQKFDGKVTDLDSRPSSSSFVTNASNENLNVETMEKLLDSLPLSDKFESDEPVHQKLLRSADRRDPKLHSLKFHIEFQKKKLAVQQLLRPKKHEEPTDKEAVAEAFKPLSKEEEAEVSRALSNSNRRKLLVSHGISNIDITVEALQCLRAGAWLNDEVINLYLELLKEREKRKPQKFLKCHFFNTFFYKKLISGKGGYNFQSVRRWTSQRKLGYCIFDCDKIFVPIHQEIHWCLAVINKKDEKFQYLDSLGGVDSRVIKVLARYIADEVKDKSGKDIDVSSWKQEYVEDLPEQENGFDCGMFMIKYADFYSRDIGLCFKQENMPYFRRRTAKEILRLKAE